MNHEDPGVTPAPPSPSEAPAADRRGMGGFFATIVGRPVAMGVIFLTFIVVGVISYQRLPQEQLTSHH